MQVCPRNTNDPLILTMLLLPYGSFFITFYSIYIYIFDCLFSFGIERITFNATCSFFLWSIALYTFPNAPLPNYYII